VVTRPLGGYLADIFYRRFGVPGKKWLTVAFGIIQGVLSIGLGVYIDSLSHPTSKFVRLSSLSSTLMGWCLVGAVIGLYVIIAIFNEAANGSNFALVPHCNPSTSTASEAEYFT
jgi:NNP family nitrate/nitrite transporter-like MFS transporter